MRRVLYILIRLLELYDYVLFSVIKFGLEIGREVIY